MPVRTKTHLAKVGELERCIDVLEKGHAQLLGERDALEHTITTLQEYNQAREVVVKAMAEEKITVYTLIRDCLAILQDFPTHRCGGEPLRTQIAEVVEQARELGILETEQEEVQDVTQ